ncbi:DegV family protein [[Clostridium] ultunense Esp]|uniref:DegV family protein n=1 Tax=[Clostridium] ultunense Esp TaxID=1288971 RepID=M1Z3T8_9FIRM|nr:DegV family protein [Schnuerera ultunensis]CCQ97565.1 DegV family protein [[Clostridium] ultunense Esp]SHD77461.1 DegV family protein [[Clostridium] ultunense Esp]
MIKIIMDSTSDLPDNIIEKYDIEILPLRVYIDNKEYLDKVTIKVEDVYCAMRKGIYPKTSLPNPKETYELFKKYASNGIDFIYYSFSSKLSSTYETSYLIIQELRKEYPDVRMEIIDTKAGSFATGLVVLQGARLAKQGASFEDIVKASEEHIQHIEHVFTINDLSWLLKGGRISKSGAIIGKALNIKPILDVQEGKMVVIKKIRGRKRALNELVNLVQQRIKEFPNQIIGITHADDLKTALEIKDMITKKIGNNNNILIEKIGSVLGSHLGIGGVGVFFFNKKTESYIGEVQSV